MTTLKEAIDTYKRLSDKDKSKMLRFISESLSYSESNFSDFIEKERSCDNKVCPHCKSDKIVKFGLKNKVQRFRCKDCKKTFSNSTGTIIAYAKKSLSTYEKYLACMLNELSIKKSAKECDISIPTAFFWRHKVLDALQNMAESIVLSGIVETDETFFNLSYKGNRNKEIFTKERPARHRGKECHKRGLSFEKVCVPCAVNLTGNAIAMASNFGKVAEKDLHYVFDNKIEEKSIVCSDKNSSYIKFAQKNNLELVQLKDGKSHEGIFHIQHINSYHSSLKSFMQKFRGVTTKYLNNYLTWNNFFSYLKEKLEILESFIFTTLKIATFRMIPKRNAVPF